MFCLFKEGSEQALKKIIIIGSGLAGAMVAYYLKNQVEITIITKGSKEDSNSMRAQGGVAAVLDSKDNFNSHINDTLSAGVNHNNRLSVEYLVKEGPEVIKELMAQGIQFDCDESGNLEFGLEGAHSFPRIIHAGGDCTGKKLTGFVQGLIKNSVEWIEFAQAYDWVIENNCVTGVRYFDRNQEVKIIQGDYFIIASGGIGQLFDFTTNHQTITGDGIAMMARIGGKLSDMAFLQFHPSLLSIDDVQPILISEAVRGAGAKLIDESGNQIMKGQHPLGDLAPRDIVSRLVFEALKQGRKVFLDISSVENFQLKFPFISNYLDKWDVPYRKDSKIPIRPGMHFMMGGIETDLNGRTSINNLYAVGEVACTGAHGANRLASNSLLEILAFGKAAANSILQDEKQASINKSTSIMTRTPNQLILPNRQELIARVSSTLGIVRRKPEIDVLVEWLSGFQFQSIPIDESCSKKIELANLCLVADLIARAALARKESLGAHYIILEENNEFSCK